MNKDYPVGSLNLNRNLVQVFLDSNINYFSPIQGKVIPKLLNNKSVLGLSQTGTGKTYAFALPIINYLLNNDNDNIQSIIVSPTNFLIDQIYNVISFLLSKINISSNKVVTIKSQKDINNNKPNIIITTPLLISTIIKKYDLSKLNYFIIDEGDMIIFDGFNEIIKLANSFIKKEIVSIFSASINIQDISRIKSAFKINTIIDVRDNKINTSFINHNLISYRGLDLDNALLTFLNFNNIDKAIIFASSKKELFTLNEKIKNINNYKIFLVHGDLSKSEINNVINQFNKSNNSLLLASDYASRGLDLVNVNNIISYSLPSDLNYYFHRAGRSGRFFSSGFSYIFYDENKDEDKKKINDLIRRGINFDIYILNKNSFRKTKDNYIFKNLGKKDQSNEKLQKQIRHAVNKTKSKKVKPNYKKKVLKAVERVKEKHRRKVILTNIGKSGGNTKDFHDD